MALIGDILLPLFLASCTLLTIIGNASVLIAFYVENKRLTTTFTMYIINLAITDFLVAALAMSFYTFDVTLGYWPFGEFMCGIWIFFDYGMTFCSVFTLVAISIDRLWAVSWPITYRQKNTNRRVFITLLLCWLAVLVVWLGPCVEDRLKNGNIYRVCIWEPSKNREFVIFIAICGHHSPCLLICGCFFLIFKRMHSRISTISTTLHHQNEGTGTGTGTTNTTTITSSGGSNNTGGTNTTTSSEENKRKKKERKAFVTLSYVILTYVICWVPFHLIFDISAVDSQLIPEWLYTTTFWLTYVNSTLNPLVYAFSNKDIRLAMIRVFCMLCRRGTNKSKGTGNSTIINNAAPSRQLPSVKEAE